MNRLAIRKRDDPEVAFQLPNIPPASDPSVALALPVLGRSEYLLDPVELEVGAPAEDNKLEVPGGLHLMMFGTSVQVTQPF